MPQILADFLQVLAAAELAEWSAFPPCYGHQIMLSVWAIACSITRWFMPKTKTQLFRLR
jgi:hypothetical protein